jgi:hypothetical protein
MTHRSSWTIRTSQTFQTGRTYRTNRLLHRLEVFVAGLPQEECCLACEVFEGDDLLLCKVAVVVVDLQQGRFQGNFHHNGKLQ